MADKNYYDVLGVGKEASEADIKKAYRKLVRKYHPDVSDLPNADEKIAELNNAYETLRDADKRREYDAMQTNPFAGAGGGFSSASSAGAGGFAWEDIKEQFGDGAAFGSGSFRFDDIFSAFGRGAREQAGSANAGADPFGSAGFGSAGAGFGNFKDAKGQDQHAELEVDLASVYTGDEYSIKLNVPTRGADNTLRQVEKTLKIKIPKGMVEGKQIRLAGQGAASLGSGSNGDLFLKVKIRSQPNIRLEGADVYQTINITPWEAALGENIKVDTPAGTLDVSIPKGSKAGSNLRLKGKGIPATPAGDLYLTINLTNPSVQTKEQHQAYEALKSAFAGQTIKR